MVQVKNTNKNVRVGVSSGNANNPIGALNNKSSIYAQEALESANNAKISEDNAHIWAEGTDGEVTPLGGVHSSKGWATLASETVANGIEELENTKDISIEEINTLVASSSQTLNLELTQHIETLNTTKNNAVADVINEGGIQIDLIQAEGQAQRDTLSGDVEGAKEAAREALASANRALESERLAESYKTDASLSADTATTQASIATNKATIATTSANNAQSYASEAKTYWQEALKQADIATTKATVASTSANNARLSETNALASEGKAKTSENNALKSAQDAEYWAEQASKGQQQADWETTDTTSVTYIKNKPSIPSIEGLATESFVQNYHDTTKQDTITDLDTIRTGAELGATALQSVPIARANVVGGVAGGNWLTVNQTTGKMECGELTKAQYNSALGYTFISKTTLNNVLVDKQDTLVSGTNIKTINGSDILGEGNLTLSTYHPPLLSCIWSDHLINDIQWLRADTFSWQDGNVYETVYNTLEEEYNNSTDTTSGIDGMIYRRSSNGYKIIQANEEQKLLDRYNSNSAHTWFYIIDTENKRFKLPRTKWGFKGLRTGVGDGINESLPNIKGGFDTIRNYYTGAFASNGWSSNLVQSGTNTLVSGIDFDASRSSSTYQDGAPVQERGTQMYLYFYVGEYAQTAIEQTAGLNAELFNGKQDVGTCVSKSGDIMTGRLAIDADIVKPLKFSGTIVQDTSTDTFQDITVYNTDNNRVGFVRFENDASGTNRVMFTVAKPNTDSPQTSVGVACNPDGAEWLICTTGVKASITNFSFPSTKFTNLTLGASGSYYTAPADGWFGINGMGKHVSLAVDGLYDGETSSTQMGIGASIAVRKGARVYLSYTDFNISSTWAFFRFIYAQGEA